MMEYLAHSAKEDGLAQTYSAHVEGVCDRATNYAEEIEQYATASGGLIKEIEYECSIWHDLGKLDDKNQEVLRDPDGGQRHLPVNHVDAGCAKLISDNAGPQAIVVYSHHKGLPNIVTECCRGDVAFRDENAATRKRTDDTLQELIKRHKQVTGKNIHVNTKTDYSGNPSVFFRMLLSCLADADHTDTAVSYGQIADDIKMPDLRACERLVALDRYVARLGGDDERSQLRREMYDSCRNATTSGSFTLCDSPVGSGKTTAVMAHLLRQADQRHARRIFVVLPYTSIIQQSVEVYRRALLLAGEDPETVVAELHCRADFQNQDIRYLTALWRAPIVVTTAVAFFETLSSNRPATLRRLHELPGSVIFVDESHNALPLRLLPLAWHWMNVLANDWRCYWVLASGSLVRFWDIAAWNQRVSLEHPEVTNLVQGHIHKRLMRYEEGRIEFGWIAEPLSRRELIDRVMEDPGPRLLIVNTVQSAAVLADDISNSYGRDKVEHLSTALSPADRDSTITRVHNRLKNIKRDNDWVLVATSCVEAGVDFSFRSGYRELSSLLSLLQASGRVNRHGENSHAKIWSFVFQDDSLLKSNPGLENSRGVLRDLFEKGIPITPDLSTQSMNNELARNDSCINEINGLMSDEENMQFFDVAEKFRVIDSDTVTAVVDSALAEEIAYGGGDWRQLQRHSVAIRRFRVNEWGLSEIVHGIYRWTLRYDSFLGYMRGVLDLDRAAKDTLLL